jgi:hypothetical protein
MGSVEEYARQKKERDSIHSTDSIMYGLHDNPSGTFGRSDTLDVADLERPPEFVQTGANDSIWDDLSDWFATFENIATHNVADCKHPLEFLEAGDNNGLQDDRSTTFENVALNILPKKYTPPELLRNSYHYCPKL